MEYIKRFFVFIYDFLVGDDLWGAVIVLLGFAGTYFLAQANIVAFWLVPLAVLISLSENLWRRTASEG